MKNKLEEYSRKRNFSRTYEPEGLTPGTDSVKDAGEKPDGQDKTAALIRKTEEALRFVVQHHLASRDHFDFRLEWDGALLSWAVPKGPSYNTRDKRLAVQVEDHPLEYRNFEGTIPKGEYGGGVVMLWDEGWWEPQVDVDEGLAEGSLKFVLKGRRLKGKWALVRIKAKEGETKNNWLLIKEKDEYAEASDGISGFTDSIRTGRTMAEIEAGEDERSDVVSNPFDKAEVQLAKLTSRIPEGDDWLYELKYDGYRIVAYLEGSTVRLITRNGHDYTSKFSDIAYSLIDWADGRSMVLDGEMVITDEQGKTDFQALQNYLKNHKGKSLTYIIFDLLALDGEDLRGRRLTERKEMLEALLKDPPKNLYYSRHVRGNGKASYQAACEKNMEGIVGKRADSVYGGTRNGDWIKLKCDTRQEFVIGGYTLSAKKTSGVSSLLLGVYEGDELVYAGRAGTGFTERSMKELEERFKSIKRESSPFKSVPAARKTERVTWLEPVLVAEIKFAEWTDENQLRQASFKGLRADKEPREVRREKLTGGTAEDFEPSMEDISNMDDRSNQHGDNSLSADVTANRGMQPGEAATEKITDGNNGIRVVKEGKNLFIGGVKISNPDRMIFDESDIKKADVVKYYAMVSERMLPYVSNRILSVVRCHKGISETCFFKKHPGADNKGIVTIPVINSSGETKEYFCIKNVSGLISEAQMGTLEFHTWGSRADDIEKPDVMVFDLDPDVGMDLDRVRQGVRDLKGMLDQLDLVSYLKTSGGKGYHVVVPFVPSADWDAFNGFARRIAEIMEQKWPGRYTSNVRKDKRRDRIFIDWIRNGRGATSIAPYSLRARKGALVSMPISWEELDTVSPDGINMEKALSCISGIDPWKDFYQTGQRLRM